MLTRFANYLKNIKGYSERTCSEYLKDLKGFAIWAKANIQGARWSTITRADLDTYISQRAESGISPTTTNRELASISALYRYFQREGLTTENPARYMSRRKVAEKVPTTIPIEDIRRAYAHTSGIVRVWLGLLATTGIRISELQSLTWERIDFHANTLTINGKGSKQRVVHTTADALADLRQLRERCNGTGCIFRNYSAREIRFQIWQALQPFSMAKQLSPHAIRHTFATNLASNGVNVSTIASILGHSQLATTQKYIDLSQARSQVANNYSII